MSLLAWLDFALCFFVSCVIAKKENPEAITAANATRPAWAWIGLVCGFTLSGGIGVGEGVGVGVGDGEGAGDGEGVGVGVGVMPGGGVGVGVGVTPGGVGVTVGAASHCAIKTGVGNGLLV